MRFLLCCRHLGCIGYWLLWWLFVCCFCISGSFFFFFFYRINNKDWKYGNNQMKKKRKKTPREYNQKIWKIMPFLWSDTVWNCIGLIITLEEWMFGISVMKCVLLMSQSSSALLSEHVLASPTAGVPLHRWWISKEGKGDTGTARDFFSEKWRRITKIRSPFECINSYKHSPARQN